MGTDSALLEKMVAVAEAVAALKKEIESMRMDINKILAQIKAGRM